MATHGQSVMDEVDVDGIPYDIQSAQRLFDRSPFDFERWAVSMIHAQPNEKQVGDKGIDGVRWLRSTTSSPVVLHPIDGCCRHRSCVHIQAYARTLCKHRGLPQLLDRPGKGHLVR